MKYKKFGTKVIFRLDKGEELVESLKIICSQLHIKLGTITGIGATNNVTVGLLDTQTKKYQSTVLTGDHEIAPVQGNITTMNNEVYLHLHINVSNKDHTSFSGHLNKAIISVTFEGVIDIFDGNVDRVLDQQQGINLLDL